MLHAVILAGGRGERFWPWSRAERPKQLLAITSPRTMLEETVRRVDPLIPRERVRVVTGQALAEPIRKTLAELEPAQVVVEPRGKNTAPAIGLAAALIAAEDVDASMVLLPSDHYVPDGVAFRDAVAYADAVARESGALVTFGIVPERAETGYGYIESGGEVGRKGEIRHNEVLRFVEKPDPETARRYFEGRGFLWNSGIFVWRVSDILGALATHVPAMAEPLEALTRAAGGPGERDAIETLFEAAPSISIDYAVMEKAERVFVVRAPLSWDDVGAWSALNRVFEGDGDGNVLRGDVLGVDASDNIVLADDGVVGLIGVSGLVVVRTGDAVLVCARERAQDVKELVQALKAREDGERYL
ncbi:MAG: mannose-1-phosphate guanyltransferase [Gemmatimonadetes bacterium]|nr:mannose-1-phosphate guanyltransferase [Gemmatimonadota bacterium]